MAQTNINIRMDEELKKQFDNFCSDVGMTKTVVRQHRIPFEISSDSDPFYSSANMARLKKSIQQMETTGGTVHEVNYDD